MLMIFWTIAIMMRSEEVPKKTVSSSHCSLDDVWIGPKEKMTWALMPDEKRGSLSTFSGLVGGSRHRKLRPSLTSGQHLVGIFPGARLDRTTKTNDSAIPNILAVYRFIRRPLEWWQPWIRMSLQDIETQKSQWMCRTLWKRKNRLKPLGSSASNSTQPSGSEPEFFGALPNLQHLPSRFGLEFRWYLR